MPAGNHDVSTGGDARLAERAQPDAAARDLGRDVACREPVVEQRLDEIGVARSRQAARAGALGDLPPVDAAAIVVDLDRDVVANPAGPEAQLRDRLAERDPFV